MGCLGAFTGGAVAGDEFLVAEFFVGVVDFAEFVADGFEERLFGFAGDADADGFFVVGFDDFGAGIVLGEDDAFFPDEFAIDEPMHFDDEAGEHSFGHEVVFVAEDEVFGVVPVIFRLVGGEQLGGDVGFGFVRDLVAEFEVLHQLEEFGAHFGVLLVGPDGFEVVAGEVAEGLADFGGVEDFVDGGGAPFGFEDDGALEEVVCLEVEADAEVVEVAAELEFVGVAFEAVGVAEGEEFGLGDVVAGVGFEGFADVDPGFGQWGADVGELADVVLDGGEDFGESAIGEEVGGEDFFEVGEAASELVFVDFAGAFLFFVFDDQGGAGFGEEFDDFEPVVEVGVVLAGVGDEEVEGAFGEEELVGGMVDFLAAEVPDVDAEGVAAGMGEVEAEYVDAFGRFFRIFTAFNFENVV